MWVVLRKDGRYGYTTFNDATYDINRVEIIYNGLMYVKK